MVAVLLSGLDLVEQRTVRCNAGGDEAAAKAASRIERNRVRTLAQPAMLPVETAHETAEAGKRRGERQHVAAAPPERVALQLERLLRIDAGMDEEHAAIP